jgi:GT2 family glycosyltransferase
MQFLRPCLDDLLHKTTYPNLQILILDNSEGDEVAELVAELAEQHPRIRRVPVELQPFNFSALINRGASYVETPYVLLLNDDVTIVTPDWIEAMMEHAQRREVGVVGAKLLYPDGTLQHAGVVLGIYQGTAHVFKLYPGDDPGYFGLPNVVRNYLAVTFACALMRTELVGELGGLDEEHLPIAFNDVDFCLRVIESADASSTPPRRSLPPRIGHEEGFWPNPRRLGVSAAGGGGSSSTTPSTTRT